jgi:hypothetical protein
MVRRATTAWAALLLGAAVLSGCGPHFTRGLSPPANPAPVLAVTPRFPIEPDVTGLPTEGVPPTRPGKYRNLTAVDCRVLAVRNAPFADDLDRHPDNTQPNHPQHHKQKAETARVAAAVRGHAADDFRNRAAGEALGEFFQLAKAEGQFDLLAAAHAELDTQLDAATRAEQAGLKDRAGIEAIRTQLLQLEAQMARLDAAIEQLNASLRARLGVDPTDPLPLWPDDPLKVRPDDVDADRAVATGLYYRPDLNLLRVLASCDGPGADELRKQVLGGLNPLLAIGAKAVSPLLGAVELLSHSKQEKADAARRTIAAVLAAREKQVEAEIRAAVLDLHGHRAAAVANAAEVRRLMLGVAELEKRQKAGQQVTAELTKARLDRLKARGELVKSAADWNAAEVKLRQSMGILVRE